MLLRTGCQLNLRVFISGIFLFNTFEQSLTRITETMKRETTDKDKVMGDHGPGSEGRFVSTSGGSGQASEEHPAAGD